MVLVFLWLFLLESDDRIIKFSISEFAIVFSACTLARYFRLVIVAL
jgi:hypothetical protein